MADVQLTINSRSETYEFRSRPVFCVWNFYQVVRFLVWNEVLSLSVVICIKMGTRFRIIRNIVCSGISCWERYGGSEANLVGAVRKVVHLFGRFADEGYCLLQWTAPTARRMNKKVIPAHYLAYSFREDILGAVVLGKFFSHQLSFVN